MSPRLKNRLFLGLATILVCGAVVAAIVVLGGPREERARALDDARVGSLSGLESQIRIFWMREKRLPAMLDELSRSSGFQPVSRDPETGAPYEYRVTGPNSYELCATFERASDEKPPVRQKEWSHAAGRRCFTLVARDPGR
jgi:hypothetical protein